jgi:hypothetical protein
MFEDMKGIAGTAVPTKYANKVKEEMAKDGITVVALVTEDDQTLILGAAMKEITDKQETKK